MRNLIPPGSTIGVLGSGQLGRMFTIAARRLGYRVHVLSPDDDTPTGQVADVEIEAPYEDLETVTRFAQTVDVVTFEFENVPVETIQAVERVVPVHPSGQVLYITQNRLREKTFLSESDLPVTRFYPIRSLPDLEVAMQELSPKAVLKTAAWGYDGKGQQVVDSGSELPAIWSAFDREKAILEEFVDFECELSVVAARSFNGHIACYNPIRNIHKNHILDVSVSPAEVSPIIAARAMEIARAVMKKLDLVGVLCVEFFLTREGELLINELAPRPHNSGHLTIDAHATCQFEQQVRAVCGLPLGSTIQFRPAAMVNLLGDLWEDGDPQWVNALTTENAKLHLYGKRAPRAGRKMGHLTVLAETPKTAQRLAVAAHESLISH